MTPTRQGSFHLFRLAGIDLYLHWSWFLVAFYAISARRFLYTSLLWNVLEYVALFAIVLMHEFGHALACRQVGGQANQIVLWPLGGVAYVAPPPRPGATLWSLAAGPLVNAVLVPIFTVVVVASHALGWNQALPNFNSFLENLWLINLVLLVFNLLPIYPLDGGQILQSILWFFVGRARSLMVASVIGLVGVAGLFILALVGQSLWIGIVAGFILLNCLAGLRRAREMASEERIPPHSGMACPNCHEPPPTGNLWVCGQCRQPFDLFTANGFCPQCGARFGIVPCHHCGGAYALTAWLEPVTAPPRF